jgi:hypothetical protein
MLMTKVESQGWRHVHDSTDAGPRHSSGIDVPVDELSLPASSRAARPAKG